MRDPGVVDQDVDLPPARMDLRDHLVHHLCIRYITILSGSRITNQLHGLLHLVFIAIENLNDRPFLGKALRYRKADSRGTPGDDCCLVLELRHKPHHCID